VEAKKQILVFIFDCKYFERDALEKKFNNVKLNRILAKTGVTKYFICKSERF
jgi:hypothetical protein